MNGITIHQPGSTAETKNVGVGRRVRPTDPDAFSNADSARVRARQLGCIGIRKYDSTSGGYVWMPCTNESDYRRQMGISHSGRLQRRREIQTEIRRFIRGKALEEMDEKSGSYTKPELRNRIKNRIMAGSSGGRPGQWSARKAQLLAQAYRKAGGGYKGGKTKRQRSLSRWTRQDWTTSDGKPANRRGGMRRYLPRAAWARLSPAQVRATNRKKIQGSRSGRQFVRNTESAMRASRSARKELSDLMMSQKALGPTLGRSRRVVAFDPDPIDADKDFIVQEDTIFERPAKPDAPKLNAPAVRRMVKPEQQTVARRLRRIDDGDSLLGAMTDPKKKKKNKDRAPKTNSMLKRQGVSDENASPPPEGSVIISKGNSGNRNIPWKTKDTEKLYQTLLDIGLYHDSKTGESTSHNKYAMLFLQPDGRVVKRKIILAPDMGFKWLRDESIRLGFLPSTMQGLSNGDIIDLLNRGRLHNLTPKQKGAVDQAYREYIDTALAKAAAEKISGVSEFDLPFPGMKYLFRRSQEINQGPISLKELNEYTLSKQSGKIRNARQVGLREAMELRMTRDAKNLKQEKLSKRDAFLLGLLDQALETEGDPLASLTQIQLDGLLEQLESPSFATDADAKIEARSDVDLVSEFGTVGFYGVAVAKANLIPEVLDVITTVDRAKNPSFFGFATWRAKKIEAGEYEDNIDAAKDILKGGDGLTGAMGRRGDQSRRLLRRADSAESLTGAMTGDERRLDYLKKRRLWQSDIIVRVMQHNQAEALRRGGLTPEQLAQEPPTVFPRWTEQFGQLPIELVGGAPGVTSYSHRVIDILYNNLAREWGANESQIFGPKPDFKIWDAPMSPLDIQDLAQNKRGIVKTFLEETIKLDPNSPFAQFDPLNMPDSDVDMLWRSYIIPELLKSPDQSKMPLDNVPFEIDPTKEELVRNYAEYLEARRLGLGTTLSEDEFDAAVEELFIGAGKDFEQFVEELNRAHDEFKQTGRLPGDFTDENLIDPDTGNIWARDKWREEIDKSAAEMLESASKLNEATQDYNSKLGAFFYLFSVGLALGYLTPEDMENLDDMKDDVMDEEEVDPLPDLTARDLTFADGTRTALDSFRPIAWIKKRFVHDVRDWAYALAQKYHPYDIQQHRYTQPDFLGADEPYTAPKTELVDLAKVDWDKFLELIDAYERTGDLDLDFPGVKSLVTRGREAKASKLEADRKKVAGNSATAKNQKALIYTLFETDSLTVAEIAAKTNISHEVVDRVIDDEAKAQGKSRQQVSAMHKKARAMAGEREDQFQQDLLARELERIKQIAGKNDDLDSYLDKLTEARGYYKDVEKQANANYSQSRLSYSFIATVANMLLQDMPDGRDWDPQKESEIAFKQRWLQKLNEIAPALTGLANRIRSMQMNPEDRVSASKRVLERAQMMNSELDAEIERIKKLKGISDAQDLRQRHQIQSMNAAREAARKAVQGMYPSMSDEEVDQLFSSQTDMDGLTGAMRNSLRGVSRGRKARKLFEYSGRNSKDRDTRGRLTRLTDIVPSLKNNKLLRQMAEWLDSLEEITVPPRMRKRSQRGNTPVSSRVEMQVRRAGNRIIRGDRDDFGMGRSLREKQTIRGLNREAKKSKINVSRYFDGRDDDEDVKWSSNDWSYAKTAPIRGADVVVYRINPNEKDPLKATEVLVISRKSGPFTGARALPGGLNDEGETLVETAMREMKEEVGISAENMQVRNLGIIQSRDWDPRFVEGVTVQGMSVKVPYTTEAVAGSDAKKAQFIPMSEILGGDGHIAFGHAAFMKEAFSGESSKLSEKLGIHERAARIRNRRIIEQVNTNRASSGQKQFPITPDSDIDTPFELIRPSDPRYKQMNDPVFGITGAISQRYDIKMNPDGTFDIVDTQNNNSRVAGPFKSRKQAVYGAIRKDRDPGFNPQILLGSRRKGRTRKAAKRKRQKVTQQTLPVAQAPTQLSFDFDENSSANRLDQSKDGLTGAISGSDLLIRLGITLAPSTMATVHYDNGYTTESHYSVGGRNLLTDPDSQLRLDIDRTRFFNLWAPYKDRVNAIVPDSERRAEPVLYIIGGPSGSLKSSIRESGLAGIPTREQAVTIDNDEIKLIMPEFVFMATSGKTKYEARAAQTVHDESKQIGINALTATMLREQASMRVSKTGKDIVFDSLGQLQDDEIQKVIAVARASGYKVVGYYFFAQEDIALKRMRARSRETKRKVPQHMHAQSMNGVRARLMHSIEFGNPDPLLDEIVFYDTNDPTRIQMAATFVLDSSKPIGLFTPAQNGRVIRSQNRGSKAVLTVIPITKADGTTGDSFAINELDMDNWTDH